MEWGYTGFTPMSVRPSVSGTFWKITIGSIHFIPGIYPYGVSLLTPIHFCVPTLIFGPLVARYLAKYLAENGVSGTFWKNWLLNSFHTWRLPLWGEFLDSYTFLAATKQLYKWYFPSVCPSVRLSVCPCVRLSVWPFWLCSHHRIIMKFSGVITNDRRKVHAKGQGQRSKVKVTEVTTHLNRFRTVTPVWIHIWWRNDAYSLMLLRRGALLFFKVIHKISRSHGCKNRRIWPRLGVSGL